MSIRPLSAFAWTGGALAGAAIAKRHCLASAAMGAILIGSVSDVLMDRHQRGQSITGAAIAGAGLIAFGAYIVRHDWKKDKT